jgi:hypothetical protein
MPEQAFPIGERIELPGHFTEPVVLEAVRSLGEGSECRVRLGDGSLEEVILSHDETVALAGHAVAAVTFRAVDDRVIRSERSMHAVDPAGPSSVPQRFA